MSIYTKDFWRDLSERVVSTFGQVAGGVLAAALAAVAAGANFADYDWSTGLFIIVITTVLAFLKGLGASAANPDTGASFGTAIPKGQVAAAESPANAQGEYVAEEASPYPEGTPVDVVLEDDSQNNGNPAPQAEYAEETHAVDGDETFRFGYDELDHKETH